MSKYLIEVTPESYDLCVFLNDGHDIPTPDVTILAFEITSPREITSKVITQEELRSGDYKDHAIIAT